MKNWRTLLASVSLIAFASGASAAEYALILAIVGTAIALAALYLGGEIAGAVNSAGSCINDTSNC